MYIIEYAQPKQAEYDKDVAIFEKKIKTLKREEIHDFLREGYVICGGVVHHRALISGKEEKASQKSKQPDPDLLKLGDEFP